MARRHEQKRRVHAPGAVAACSSAPQLQIFLRRERVYLDHFIAQGVGRAHLHRFRGREHPGRQGPLQQRMTVRRLQPARPQA